MPVEEPPRTLAGEINLVLEHSYPGRSASSDQELAASVNAYAGKDHLISADDIARLRAGDVRDVPRIVREGLANAVGVSGLRLMLASRQGRIGRIRARGATADGLSPKALSILTELASELEKKSPEDG